MSYVVEFAKRAAKQFRALPKSEQKRIAAKIDALTVDPRLPGSIKLVGEDDLYRVRVGNYRIIYS